MYSAVHKPGSHNWSARGLFEYMLVGKPDNGVSKKVMDIQAHFSAVYGEQGMVTGNPHIEVAHFFASEAMEPTIIKWMQRIIGGQPGFIVTLDNYSGFPPGTIYLRVQDLQPFQQMTKKLQAVDDFIRASDCPPLWINGRPGLCIAGGLPAQVYDKAMATYARKVFYASFVLEEFVLLKRGHVLDSHTTVQVFRLRPADSNLCCGAA